MPARYYTRRIGNVELFVLDSNRVTKTQGAWLGRALARSRARWKVAVFHHPARSCGVYRGDTGRVASWLPVLRRGGVQLVLNGHDHNYQRFSGRPTYIVEGGGGANLYPLRACRRGTPRLAFGRSTHGFLVLEFHPDRLTGTRLGLDNAVVDRFAVTR